MKRIFKLILLIVIIPLVYLLVVIMVGSFTDFKPQNEQVISNMEEKFEISSIDTFRILSWNIGYAGLGEEMDFFFDGGENVRDSKENTLRNFTMIKQFLGWNEDVDFYFLQEVDKSSKRSYKIDQVDEISNMLNGHFPFFAANYKVAFVPKPFLRPMGKVFSGLLSLSVHVPQKTVRHSFPGNYSWPMSLFMLDRCFLVNRYSLENGKELVMINTHNSAYDDGTLRSKQMEYLKGFLQEEENKGNYVVVGGDWNQSPPNFAPKYEGQVFDTVNCTYIADDFLPKNWNWIYDKDEPTNRRVTMPYEKGKTPVTLIDFFLVSDNIEVLACKTIPMDFKYSDHQPVYLKFKLHIDE